MKLLLLFTLISQIILGNPIDKWIEKSITHGKYQSHTIIIDRVNSIALKESGVSTAGMLTSLVTTIVANALEYHDITTYGTYATLGFATFATIGLFSYAISSDLKKRFENENIRQQFEVRHSMRI